MMGPQKSLFRKAALDKLASPEQLDLMMQVTSPAGWLAVSTLGALLLLAVVWSVTGRIAIRVEGQGILIRGGAVSSVSTTGTGRVVEIEVRPGDVVRAGQVVARLSQEDLELRLQHKQEELASLSAQGEGQAVQTGALVAQYQTQARELRAKVRVQESMVARGLLTRGTLIRTREQLANTESLIVQAQAADSARGNRVDDARRGVEELQSKLNSAAAVVSPFAGRVIELMASPGDLVEAGSRLLTLEPIDQPVRSVLYIPAGEGKKIQAGMEVRISPSTVRAEEYGFIIGKVRDVSEFPVTPDGLQRVLRNPSLVQTLLEKGAPIEVMAELVPDRRTPSGYRWSSSSGPPSHIESGTLCAASVVVDRRRPISYVLPLFKSTVGAS